MVKGLVEDRIDVLIAMYGYFLTEEAGPLVSVFDLKRKASLLLGSAYIALLLENLSEQNLVTSDVGDNDTDVYTLTEPGVLRAENEVLERGLTLDEFEVQWRRRLNSGLIVDTNHPELTEAKAALAQLEKHLRSDNDLGEISAEEKDIALSEVSELQISISKPTIRTSYLWNKGNEVLMWIMEKGAGSVVGELARSALQHIHSFINVFFN